MFINEKTAGPKSRDAVPLQTLPISTTLIKPPSPKALTSHDPPPENPHPKTALATTLPRNPFLRRCMYITHIRVRSTDSFHRDYLFGTVRNLAEHL